MLCCVAEMINNTRGGVLFLIGRFKVNNILKFQELCVMDVFEY